MKRLLILSLVFAGVTSGSIDRTAAASLVSEAEGAGQDFSSTRPHIRLQNFTFDPLIEEPNVPPRLRARATSRRTTYLLQFAGPVREEWKTAVGNSGAQLYGYLPDYAFIALMDAATAERVAALPFVRWVGPYHPAYRLASSLRQPEIGAREPSPITVQTLPGADLDALADQARAWGGEIQGRARNASAGYLRLTLDVDHLDALSALDGVLWIEPYFEPELHNDVGGGTIMRADEIRADLGLYGEGQIVAVADSGLDTGNQSTLHPDVRGRLVKAYCLGRPDPCDWSDYVAHGTHVAGSVLANGAASGSDPATHDYANAYAGTAPEAQLIFQSLADAYGQLGGVPEDRGDLMRTAYDDGARIHTNSWGGPTGGAPQEPAYGGYVAQSQQVDQAMWDRPDMLILYSAGNNGVDAGKDGVVDPDSIGQPGTAKNVLTVGASENDRGSIASTWGDSYGAPIATDQKADDPDGLAAFSSRGPTDDGRIKPEIVAPGTYIASMRTRRYVFEDDMEGDTSGYQQLSASGGTAAWQLLTDAAHSPTHYWRQTLNGTYNAGAMTILVTPPFNAMPAGSFDIYFWHTYSLGANDRLYVILFAPDINDPQQTKNIMLTLNVTGAQNTYKLQELSGLPVSLLVQQGLNPTALMIGFAIGSDDATINSTWSVDDIRVDGSDWGTMSSVGLAQQGDATDEAYLMMGGTSMATPLTAGAAALVREWYNDQGVANPSGALMKATLLNGAADMAPGQYGAGGAQEVPAQRPNNVTGWGRVDLVESLNPPDPRTIWFTDTTTGLSTGGSAVYTLTVAPAQVSGQGDEERGRHGEGETRVEFSSDRAIQEMQPLAGFADARHVQGMSQMLQNPGFESGAWSPWQTYNNPALVSDVKHSGAWAAHFGNANSADDQFWQVIDIPADATEITLDFWYRLSTDETYESSDYFYASIWDPSGSPVYVGRYADFGQTGDVDWTREVYSLNATELASVVGKTVHVGFIVQTDYSLASRAWVDDTALYITTTTGTSATLALTPASGPRGTTFAVTGSDFNASDAITIAVDGADQTNIASNAEGGFSFDLTPPGTITKGSHTVTATDSGGHSAEDAFEIVPQVDVTITPTSGQAGDAFEVTGNGFHGGSAITVTLDGGADGTATADTDGAFTYTLTTDAGITAGAHTVRATDDEASTASDTFTITAPSARQVSIAPTSGPTGTTFTITGANFTASAVVTLTVDGAFVKTTTADGSGDLSTTYTPTDLSAGQHTLRADDGDGHAKTTFTITAPAQTGGPLRLTLAWTDYPGTLGAAKALVNDLDLEIIAPDGTRYYGNEGLYTGGTCLRDGKWDACNNVEGAIIPDARYGTYTVIVHGHNIPQGPQPFALVAAGDNVRAGSSSPVPTPTRQISISPEKGDNGTPFTITGANFTASAAVTLTVDSAFIRQTNADGIGAFTTIYTPTGLAEGDHTLVADDGQGQAQATFSIEASYSIYLPIVLRLGN